MAGFHTLRSGRRRARSRSAPTSRCCKPGLHKIIGFARRSQGLIVAPRQSARPAATGRRRAPARALRQPGAGHRHAAAARRTAGARRAGRPTPSTAMRRHRALARGRGAGRGRRARPMRRSGIEAAALGAGLDFVPLVQERYYLVCLKSALEQPAIQALLVLLRGAAWQHQLARCRATRAPAAARSSR